MAGAQVQIAGSVAQDDATTYASVAATFGSNTTSGNLIEVWVGYGGSTDTSTVSDTDSNTYNNIGQHYDSTNGQSFDVYCAENITGGTTPTVTVTFNTSQPYNRILIREISGLATTSAYDVSAVQSANGTTATDNITSTAATTTNANSYLSGGYQNIAEASPGTGSLSAGTNYTKDGNYGSDIIAVEHRNVTSTGSYAATFTKTVAHRYTAWIVAYKEAGGGGSSPLLLLDS